MNSLKSIFKQKKTIEDDNKNNNTPPPNIAPIGFEGIRLDEDSGQKSVENTSFPSAFPSTFHYENNNYYRPNVFGGTKFGFSGFDLGDSRFKNPFDDPFFKDSNFPTMPGFDKFKPTQPTNPHPIKPEQPKPSRPDPPKPSRPNEPIPTPTQPKPNTNNKGGYMSAGMKLINEINVPISGILSRFNERMEKNKSNEVVKRNIVKDPKRFRDSFTKIVNESHIDNFITSQNYSSIKSRHSNTNRFTDPEFKACQSSLYFSSTFQHNLLNTSNSGVAWRRAKDLVSDAHFTVDQKGVYVDPRSINESNYRRFFQTTDLDQGAVGNCWFISAAAGIIQNYDLFKKVVPIDNSFETTEYTGAFRFRFWIFGAWKEVVIDDYLPVNPNTNQLLFCRNRDCKNEFWCALLEKAYAKIYGSYEALDGGLTTDALIDMSGGIEEEYDLKKIRKTIYSSSSYQYNSGRSSENVGFEQFWEILVNARKKNSVIGASINVLPTDYRIEARMSNGLVRGHAYIITKMAEIEIRGVFHKIIRVYNPWGNDVEWNGEWSDKSTIWRSIDAETKEALELKFEHDGEFWMSFRDFVLNYDDCQICNLTPTTVSNISETDWENQRLVSSLFSMWQCEHFEGKWIKGLTAGGCSYTKYWSNPQFTFVINESDIVHGDTCWVIIGLMQKDTRRKRATMRIQSAEEYIQIRLYRIKDVKTYYESLRLKRPIESHELERFDSSGSYINKREVTCRSVLKQGAYLVIPSTYEEGKEGEFLLRIFTEKPLSDAKSCSQMVVSSRNMVSNLGSSMTVPNRSINSAQGQNEKDQPPPIGFIDCDFEKIDIKNKT